jgi:hypothetical protein
VKLKLNETYTPVVHVVPIETIEYLAKLQLESDSRGKVLTVGNDFDVRLWVDSALEAVDQVVDVCGSVQCIFTWSLLATSPTRVSPRIDVGGEVVKSGAMDVVKRARLCADYCCDGLGEL